MATRLDPIMNWLREKEFDSYWCKTAGVGALTTFLLPHSMTILQSVVNFAFNKNYRQSIPKLETAVNYSKNNWPKDSIIHFLILAGYFTYKELDGEFFASIPNGELYSHWK